MTDEPNWTRRRESMFAIKIRSIPPYSQYCCILPQYSTVLSKDTGGDQHHCTVLPSDPQGLQGGDGAKYGAIGRKTAGETPQSAETRMLSSLIEYIHSFDGLGQLVSGSRRDSLGFAQSSARSMSAVMRLLCVMFSRPPSASEPG